MATSFTNNWKNILDKLTSVFRDEFKGSLKIYVGSSQDAGNQYLRIDPLQSNLLEYNATSETREFSISMTYHFRDANAKNKALDHILRYVSRIEALIAKENFTMTLADSSQAFNCRFESTELNTDEESGAYIAEWDWKCQHNGNLD